MNNTCDSDEAASVLSLILEVIPLHDWKGVEGYAPVQLRTLLIELLLQLLYSALLNLILLELLKIEGEPKLLPQPDGPFGGVILPKLDGVAIIAGEFVVEIVVTFSEGYESREDVVTRRVAVVEWLVAKPVCKRVDAESGLLDEEDSENTAVDEPAEPVTPA